MSDGLSDSWWESREQSATESIRRVALDEAVKIYSSFIVENFRPNRQIGAAKNVGKQLDYFLNLLDYDVCELFSTIFGEKGLLESEPCEYAPSIRKEGLKSYLDHVYGCQTCSEPLLARGLTRDKIDKVVQKAISGAPAFDYRT